MRSMVDDLERMMCMRKQWSIAGMLLILVLVLSTCQKGGIQPVLDREPDLVVEGTTKEIDQKEQTLVDLNEKELAIVWKPYAAAYVTCEDFARIVDWEYDWDADSFMFQEYEIQLDFVVGSCHVTRLGKIVDMMPQCPILEDQKIYLSVDWLEESFGEAVKRKDDRMEIIDPEAVSIYQITKFFSEDLTLALEHPGLDSSIRVMEAIELPRSMEIQVPKIDPSRMMKLTPIREFAPEFQDELRAHGYSDEEIDSISISEYKILEAHWLIPAEMQAWALRDFPEYTKEEVERWTYADFSKHRNAETELARLNRFSKEELRDLQERGIVEDDLFYLLKEFHQPASIVKQSDEALREVLEGYYRFSLSYGTEGQIEFE